MQQECMVCHMASTTLRSSPLCPSYSRSPVEARFSLAKTFSKSLSPEVLSGLSSRKTRQQMATQYWRPRAIAQSSSEEEIQIKMDTNVDGKPLPEIAGTVNQKLQLWKPKAVKLQTSNTTEASTSVQTFEINVDKEIRTLVKDETVKAEKVQQKPKLEETEIHGERIAEVENETEKLRWRRKEKVSEAQPIDIISKEKSAEADDMRKAHWRPKAKSTEELPGTTVVHTQASEKPEDAKATARIRVTHTVLQRLKKKSEKIKKRIEEETNTSLRIPQKKNRKEGFIIVVEGSSDEAVQEASKRIQYLLQKIKWKEVDPFEAVALSQQPPLLEGASTAATAAVEVKQHVSGSLIWRPKSALPSDRADDKVTQQTSQTEKFSGSLHVDANLLRLVKGRRGETKNKIEKETNTRIRVGDPVMVEGPTEDSVQKALEQIQKAVEEAINSSKFNYSHFVSLPLCFHPELVARLEAFQASILESEAEKWVEPDNEEPSEVISEAPAATSSKATEQGTELQSDTVRANSQNEDEQKEAAVENSTKADDFVLVSGEAVKGEQEIQEAAVLVHESETGESQPEYDSETSVASCECLPTEIKEKKDSEEVMIGDDVVLVVDGDAEDDADADVEPKDKSASRIDKSIFIKSTRFHLTVLMLKLWNEERLVAATEVFKNIVPKVVAELGETPLKIKLNGLECMRGKPTKASVLYVKVEEVGDSNRLIHACETIIKAYVEAGLVIEKDAEKSLKLHATVMNESHRKGKGKRRRRSGFDAREIIEKYGSEEWGEYELREAHLSERFKYDENDYYHCCASMPLQSNGQD